MRILVATHHLADWGGTETYTLTLAKALVERGHVVFVYSPFPGAVSREVEKAGIAFTKEIGAVRREPFSVAHVHHNVVATQVRSALPEVPMVWVSHGLQPELERPPTFVPEVTLAIAPLIVPMLRRSGISAEVVPNMIDTAWFTAQRPIGARPAAAVVLTNEPTPELRAGVWEACRLLGIPVRHVGRPGNSTADVRPALEQADLVLASGRSALEAGAMERAVLVYGRHGCGGWLDRAGYVQAFETGFSSRLRGRILAPKELAELITDQYSPRKGPEAREVVVQHHALEVVIPRLEEAYRRAIEGGLRGEELQLPRLGFGLAEQLSLYQRELRNLRSLRAVLDAPAYRFVRRIADALSRSRVYRAMRRLDDFVARLAGPR